MKEPQGAMLSRHVKEAAERVEQARFDLKVAEESLYGLRRLCDHQNELGQWLVDGWGNFSCRRCGAPVPLSYEAAEARGAIAPKGDTK